MSRNFAYILAYFFLLLIVSCASPDRVVEKAFIIDEKDLIPEGIAYNPVSAEFFVGSIAKKKIIAILEDGTMRDFISSGQDGIGEVLGMEVDVKRQLLYAVSNIDGVASFVHIYNMKGELANKVSLMHDSVEVHLFNDLVLDSGGVAFITDSYTGTVYSIPASMDSLKVFARSSMLGYANGITISPDGGYLIISATGSFVRVELSSATVSRLPFKDYYVVGVDGLYVYEKSLIGIQNTTFPTSVNRYFLNDAMDRIDSAVVLCEEDPAFDIPTTGVVVDKWFYFIANSQLTNYDGGHVMDSTALKQVVIGRFLID